MAPPACPSLPGLRGHAWRGDAGPGWRRHSSGSGSRSSVVSQNSWVSFPAKLCQLEHWLASGARMKLRYRLYDEHGIFSNNHTSTTHSWPSGTIGISTACTAMYGALIQFPSIEHTTPYTRTCSAYHSHPFLKFRSKKWTSFLHPTKPGWPSRMDRSALVPPFLTPATTASGRRRPEGGRDRSGGSDSFPVLTAPTNKK